MLFVQHTYNHRLCLEGLVLDSLSVHPADSGKLLL